MEKLKVRLRVNTTAALRAGKNEAGVAEVEVPETLTAAQREALLTVPEDRSVFDLSDLKTLKYLPSAADASPETIAMLLDAWPRAVAKLTEANAAKDRARIEKANAFADKAITDNQPFPYQEEIALVRPELKEILQAQEIERARIAKEKGDARWAKEQEAIKEKQKIAADEKKAREDWIAINGSTRLQRMVEENIDCTASYRDERLAVDRPGWDWLDSNAKMEVKDPRNPPMGAFDLLDEARKLDLDAGLDFYRLPLDEYSEEIETGYIVTSKYMDKWIVYEKRFVVSVRNEIL